MITSSYRPAAGRFLISEPFMVDQNFQRSVVLLVEHNDQGSLGFVLNRMVDTHIHQVVDGISSSSAPVFMGGPVEPNTLHYIHQIADLSGAKEVYEGVYFGGEFADLKHRMRLGQVSDEEILFFVGYSGWGPGQLDEEMKRKSWIVAPEEINFVFRPSYDQLWQDILRAMGQKFKVVSNYPVDPRLN